MIFRVYLTENNDKTYKGNIQWQGDNFTEGYKHLLALRKKIRDTRFAYIVQESE